MTGLRHTTQAFEASRFKLGGLISGQVRKVTASTPGPNVLTDRRRHRRQQVVAGKVQRQRQQQQQQQQREQEQEEPFDRRFRRRQGFVGVVDFDVTTDDHNVQVLHVQTVRTGHQKASGSVAQVRLSGQHFARHIGVPASQEVSCYGGPQTPDQLKQRNDACDQIRTRSHGRTSEGRGRCRRQPGRVPTTCRTRPFEPRVQAPVWPRLSSELAGR